MIPQPAIVQSSKADVVGVGAATLDDLWLVPSFSNEEGVTLASQHIQMGGGPVATALCVLGCLGHSVSLLDAVGDDGTGDSILAELRRNGVISQGIVSAVGARSARAVILVRERDGARQIAYLPSTAGELKLNADQAALVRQSRMLHINGRHEEAAREAVMIARASGVPVSFDGGAGRYRESLRDLVDQSHLKILSIDFARRFCGADDLSVMQDRLLTPDAELVVITDGTNGSHVALPGGKRFHQRAYQASPLVDSTGCGDVYHGAFLHGWLHRWPVEKCADFASRLAAQNAEGLGGRWVCQRPSMVSCEGGF